MHIYLGVFLTYRLRFHYMVDRTHGNAEEIKAQEFRCNLLSTLLCDGNPLSLNVGKNASK